MAMNAKNAPGGGTPITPMDAGTYPAKPVALLDLGLQPQSYKGEKKTPVREVMLTYEFADEFLKDEDGQDIPDKPRWLSETFALYNLKADKAKSTARYNAIDPAGEADGDFYKLLDRPCLVTVVHSPKNDGNGVWENIAGVSAMRAKEAAKAPPLVNAVKILDLDEPDIEVFLSLPKWVQDKIKAGLEFNGSPLDRMLEGGDPPKQEENKEPAPNLDDEIPF